ncbi:hypothetical protein ABIA00_000437 [Bradyrhizobium ottawaense]
MSDHDGLESVITIGWSTHIDPMFERKPRYRNPRFKAGRDKTVLRCGVVSPAPIPANKPDPQFLIIV